VPARFHEQGVRSRLKDKRRLSAFLDTLVRRHMPQVRQVQLHYIFCTDDYLLDINKKFLRHNTLTDIITFNMSDTPAALQGEIYISTDRVRENAGIFSTGYNHELHRVIFHGALHLCGFGDKRQEEQAEMRRREEEALKKYFDGL